ncbi:MAG TPA: dihydrodipicolinate synthase family protein [Burkholderiales bacterium]|nr:dihydrodipicolinate synthase family protein [Burkholderiales bacterium]
MATTAPFSGIYPMMYSFFGRDGSLDRGAMRRQVEACVRGGAHGIAVLGLATETGKLSAHERRQLVEWVTQDAAQALPVAVTVSEPTVAAQAEFADWAKSQGASWVILQPPPERGMPEAWYVDFFARVMERVQLPCAIQNAPEYIGVGLGAESIRVLKDRCPNFSLLKGEGPVLTIRRVIEAVEGELAVFNGRGGLELPDNLRAGCAGVIPATDTFDYQVRVFELMRRTVGHDERMAEEIYRRILPAIVFALQSLDTLICYGKRIAALRLGLPATHDRAPGLSPTDFGIDCARRYADMLGPLA